MKSCEVLLFYFGVGDDVGVWYDLVVILILGKEINIKIFDVVLFLVFEDVCEKFMKMGKKL